MKRLLYVGEHEDDGRFRSKHWTNAIASMEVLSDNVRFYTRISPAEIKAAFGAAGDLEIESPLDADMDVSSVRVWVRSPEFWERLKALDFDPSGGFSHAFFLRGDVYVGGLESDDGPNFIVLCIARNEGASHQKGDVETQQKAREWMGRIADLTDGDTWELVLP